VFQTSFDRQVTSTSTWVVLGIEVTASMDSPLCALRLGPGAAPSNLVAPAIAGEPLVGQVLAGDRGLWAGYPAHQDLQWQREGVAGSWADIPGATQLTYTPTSADLGRALRFQVTALGPAGSAAVAHSSPTEAVIVSDGPLSVNRTTLEITVRFIPTEVGVREAELRIFDASGAGAVVLLLGAAH
jgi:hypothetical protein